MFAVTFFRHIQPYVLPVLAGAVSVVLSAVLIVFTVRQIKRQVRLYNSITLVELKSAKIHYWVFIIITGFFLFFLFTQLFDPQAPEAALMAKKFNMQTWQTNLMLSLFITLLLCIEFFLTVLAVSRAAVVDRGVYTGFSHLDWYHVHDYIIDEDRGLVILTSNKNTFLTLSGTTAPLKVAKNDIPKLKFILNKNKNKFSGFLSEKL